MKILNLLLAITMVSFMVACGDDEDIDDLDDLDNESIEMTDAGSDAAPNTANPNLSTQPAGQGNDAQFQQPQEVAEVPQGPTTTMSVDKMSHDFGTIPEGEKVNTTFTIENTGDEPLIISNAKAGCGCTVPSWPKEPIPPGETGEIKVAYDSKNKGAVGGKKDMRTVTITANTNPPQTRLQINVNVTKDEAGG